MRNSNKTAILILDNALLLSKYPLGTQHLQIHINNCIKTINCHMCWAGQQSWWTNYNKHDEYFLIMDKWTSGQVYNKCQATRLVWHFSVTWQVIIGRRKKLHNNHMSANIIKGEQELCKYREAHSSKCERKWSSAAAMTNNSQWMFLIRSVVLYPWHVTNCRIHRRSDKWNDERRTD